VRGVVRAFLPMSVPPAVLLEVEYAIGPLRAAMDRGARVGMLLVVGSVFALAAILFTVLEHEVVAPIARVNELLPDLAGGRTDDMRRLESGVVQLLQKEQAAEGLAAAQQKQLAEQAGFAQVGEMAAEMAHEFKRPLASIQSAVRLLSQEYVLESRGQELLSAVDDQLAHLSETMRDLFALARPVGVAHEEVALQDVLDASLALLAGHHAAINIELRRDYREEPVLVEGDAKRLQQAAFNLLLNAAEAMSGTGTLTLRAGRAGANAFLEVEDTGAGIPESELEHVLLPFYSTKPAGTGLGLPLVARIVAAHEGRISIQSVVGRGTCIRVELPLAHTTERAMARAV